MPREIILRSEGRVRYLRVSSRTQAIAFGIVVAVSASSLATSIGMAVQQISLRGRDIAVHRADDAYTHLLTEVTGYFDRFSKSTNSTATEEANLLGLTPEDRSARLELQALSENQPRSADDGTAVERDRLRNQLRAALRLKLLSFDQDLQRIAARNQSLAQQVTGVTARAEAAERERDRVTALRDALARDLSDKQAENTGLAAQAENLASKITGLNTQLDLADGQAAVLNESVSALQGQLAEFQDSNEDLQRQVGQTQHAMATLIAQRNLLQIARTDMSGSIEDLQQRLASIQESQASFVSHLTERARQNLGDMEKTVQMTGLNVDRLLRITNEQFAGQGGPFIPAPTDTKDANERKLLESVATLDDEVGRWEKLQVILRSLPLSAPVDHYYISSGFGERTDPFNGEGAIHEGLDMVDAIRSDVLATAPGKVVFAGWRGSYGRCVEIDHGLGIHTIYAHLDSILVKVGDLVDYRQNIAKLGNSGRSSGAHVHYEVRFENVPLDPMGFLKAGRYVFKG